MFKQVRAILALGCLGLASAASAATATVGSVASLANPLDNNGGGARAVAMGSAFVAVADDSSAVLWNPAGLGTLEKAEIALHHNSWLGGIVQETAVLGLPLGSLGGLGASVNYVNYGTLAGYDEAGAQTSDYSANRYGFGLGWGLEILKGLSAGVGAKGALQTIENSSYSNVSADLGVLWEPMQGFKLGLAYSNLGTMVAGYSQASTLRGGASYLCDFSHDNQLLLAAAAAWEPQGVGRLQVGVEETLYRMLALRLGYQQSLADNQLQTLQGLSAGLGVKVHSFGVDYAFLPYGDLGAAHRLSLSYRFD